MDGTPIDLPSYVGFTDAKFQRVERKDCLLVQNTKDYFAVYLPLTLLLFALLNRLSRRLATHRIGQCCATTASGCSCGRTSVRSGSSS